MAHETAFSAGIARAVALLFALAACGGSGGGGRGGPSLCTPGASVGCTCPGGAQGAQVCQSDGTFGACDCGTASGSSTSGGASGSATSCPVGESPTFGTAVTYRVGLEPESVAIGDLNGDGEADLAVANHDDNTVSVLLNEGSGRFGTAVTYGVGSGPQSVAIGDLNGDGKADLAVATQGSYRNPGTVSVLLNECQ